MVGWKMDIGDWELSGAHAKLAIRQPHGPEQGRRAKARSKAWVSFGERRTSKAVLPLLGFIASLHQDFVVTNRGLAQGFTG